MLLTVDKTIFLTPLNHMNICFLAFQLKAKKMMLSPCYCAHLTLFSALANNLNSLNTSELTLFLLLFSAPSLDILQHPQMPPQWFKAAFLLLWHADDIAPFTEASPHETLKHHIQRAFAGSSLRALLRKTEVTLKHLWFSPAKTADRVNRCPGAWACVRWCVWVQKKKKGRDSTGEMLCVCSLEFSGEPCGSLSYTSHK